MPFRRSVVHRFGSRPTKPAKDRKTPSPCPVPATPKEHFR